MTPSATSTAARPPWKVTQWRSPNMMRCFGSSRCEGVRIGRRLNWNARSASRCERLPSARREGGDRQHQGAGRRGQRGDGRPVETRQHCPTLCAAAAPLHRHRAHNRAARPSRAGPSEPRRQAPSSTTERSTSPALHATEGGLDVAQGDGLADEAVEVEPPLEVELDEDGEVTEGRQSRTSSASAGRPGRKNSIIGRSMRISGSGRRPGRGCRPGRGALEGLLHHRRLPTASMQTSAPLPR